MIPYIHKQMLHIEEEVDFSRGAFRPPVVKGSQSGKIHTENTKKLIRRLYTLYPNIWGLSHGFDIDNIYKDLWLVHWNSAAGIA